MSIINNNQKPVNSKEIKLNQAASYQAILNGNRNWVASRVKDDPEYFINLAKGQIPEILWIGCSDSRVPANEVTGTKPEEVFVHRNITNVCVHSE